MLFDPLDQKKYRGVEVLGLIPSFINDSDVVGKGFREALGEQYGFGLYETTGGSISDEGVYSYPEDPDLQPLALYESPTEKCYQYDYAIIAIVSKDGSTPTFVTRMD